VSSKSQKLQRRGWIWLDRFGAQTRWVLVYLYSWKCYEAFPLISFVEFVVFVFFQFRSCGSFFSLHKLPLWNLSIDSWSMRKTKQIGIFICEFSCPFEFLSFGWNFVHGFCCCSLLIFLGGRRSWLLPRLTSGPHLLFCLLCCFILLEGGMGLGLVQMMLGLFCSLLFRSEPPLWLLFYQVLIEQMSWRCYKDRKSWKS